MDRGAPGGRAARGLRARGVAGVVVGAAYLVLGALFLLVVSAGADAVFLGALAVVGVIAIVDGAGAVRAAGAAGTAGTAGWPGSDVPGGSAGPAGTRGAWPHAWLLLAGLVVTLAGSVVVFLAGIPDRAGVGFALAVLLWVLGAVPLLVGLRTSRDLRTSREAHASGPSRSTRAERTPR